MAFFGIGVLLTFFTGDERFLLVKDSLHTSVAGLLFLGTCVARRPLTFAITKRFAAADDQARRALDAKWAAEPRFRRAFYVTSLVWVGPRSSGSSGWWTAR
jgi:hypothetical protein